MTLWIDDAATLRAFCREAGDDAIAVDTESDHFHAYNARVCLIQVATPDTTAIIDPLAIDAGDMKPLLRQFEDRSVEKILHSARNDIRELDRDYGTDFCRVFDTQVAARFLDYQRNSLDWLLENLCDVEPGPGFGRFDWTRRPLPQKALEYAATDVLHLFEMRRRFREELENLGWLEAVEQQCAYICRSTEYQSNPFDPEGWRSIRGVSKLDGRGRAVARQLYLWRHELCDKRNQAPVTCFPNSALRRLAKKRPSSLKALEEMSHIPGPLVEKEGTALLEQIRRGEKADMPPRRAPERPTENVRPSADERARYDRLRTWRNDLSRQLSIPGEFIAINATLRQIAAEPPRSVDELGQFDAILPWHCDVFGEELLEAMGQ